MSAHLSFSVGQTRAETAERRQLGMRSRTKSQRPRRPTSVSQALLSSLPTPPSSLGLAVSWH